MKILNKAVLPIACIYVIITVLSSCASKERIEKIAFETDNSTVSDSIKTIKSFKKQQEFYVLTQFGSYDEKMEWLNNYLLAEVNKNSVVPSKVKKQMCSIFFTTNSSGITYHCQNLDNPESGILIGSFNAPGKYKSIALSRMTDISYFPASFEFTEINETQKTFLPFFAFYPADGINEYGLSVSVAGSYPHKVTETKDRKGVFITYLNRLMLDSCKTVEEALALSKRYYFFDHEGLISSNHLLIADKSGTSAIIEYNKEGRMDYLVKKKENLVMTNDDIIGADTSQIKCVRFKNICKELSNKPVSSFDDCMKILQNVRNNTLWAVVMDNKSSTGYIAIRGKYTHFYKFALN